MTSEHTCDVTLQISSSLVTQLVVLSDVVVAGFQIIQLGAIRHIDEHLRWEHHLLSHDCLSHTVQTKYPPMRATHSPVLLDWLFRNVPTPRKHIDGTPSDGLLCALCVTPCLTCSM